MISEFHDFATPILHDNHATWMCAISVFDSTYYLAPTSHLTTEGVVHQFTPFHAVGEDNEGPFVIGIFGNGRRGRKGALGMAGKVVP